MKQILFTSIFLSFYLFSFSQDYVEMMQNRDNIYQVSKKFEEYWQGKKIEKGKGWKQFKRWENFWTPRLYPSGDFTNPSIPYEEIIKLHKKYDAKSVIGNWTIIGPQVVPQGGGAGRLNSVNFQSGQLNTLWVGAAAGGIWKSTNGGTNWTTNTDKFTALGMSNIAINPQNTNIMYAATGDVDASDTYGVGVLKSTDGGQTWETTGLNWNITQSAIVNKVLIHPSNPVILLAATNNGLYRSEDAAFTWVKLKSGNFYDMEFKPNDPSVVYVVSNTKLFKSVDGGVVFNLVSGGLPSTGINRCAIAVTPGNPNYIYLLASRDYDYGFYGLYLSEDAGATFTLQANSPNLFTWASDGDGSGGQGWYDIALAVSPVDADIVLVGGVNIWRSLDKGVSWDCVAHWYGEGGLPYVHADIHALEFSPFNYSTVFAATDGGLFKSTNEGNTWTDISSGLAITQIYKIGMDPNDGTKFLGGNQDNGTNRYMNGQWRQVLGGDGMECITSGTTMYGSFYYGALYRSNNSGDSFSEISYNITSSEQGAWVTPFCLSPSSNTTLYAGYINVWKSTNSGNSWQKISDFQSGVSNINVLTVAPSNTNYIYIAFGAVINRTTNGGSSWEAISNIASASAVTSIAVHPTDPAKLWITNSGYTAGNKVFYSSNAGTSWVNISGSLPNVPTNCITYEKFSNDALYAGTDIGVFYKNADMDDWLPFNGGLPNVIINELEIVYPISKIRAATYGRGVWEADLYNFDTRLPWVEFSADKTSGCPGLSVQFTDNTLFDPVSWSWEFEGGTPAVSTEQNPVIAFNTPGKYNVKLTAFNANGQSETIKTELISIREVLFPFAEDFEGMQQSEDRYNVDKGNNARVFISDNDALNFSYFMVIEGSMNYSSYTTPTIATAFSTNPEHFAKAVYCVDATSAQSVGLQFDYRQLYLSNNNNTNFRVTVNGNPISNVYQPAGSTTPWNTELLDISSFAGTKFELGFEGNNRTIFNNILQGRGNASLIDNININTFNSFGENNNHKTDVIIFPNPASEKLNIYFSDKIKNIDLNIVNTQGVRLVSFKKQQSENLRNIDISNLNAGVYYVHISGNNFSRILYFVKF